jgi:exopolysaccharide biosynthesis polyprenyl glycosylphosphotransferase
MAMTTTDSTTAHLDKGLLARPARSGRPTVAEPDIRRQVLAGRLLGDVGAVLLGLMAAQGIQQALLALNASPRPRWPVGVFNGLAILIWIAVFANAGLYDARRLSNAADEVKLILQSVATGTMVATFAAFALKVPTQRSWVLAVWIGCSLAMLATRLGYRAILRALRRSGMLVSRMLIVGAGREGRDLCRVVTRARWLGFQVVGFLDDDRPPGPVAAGLPEVIGPTVAVCQAVDCLAVNAVLVAGGSVSTETAERVYRDLQRVPVDFHLSTGILGVAASRVAVQRFDDVPILGLRRVELTRRQRAVKRCFDLVVAGLLLVALSPVMLACALAVRLTSPGPVLFRQRRFGEDGRVFWMHKFRSMVVDAEDRQPALRAVANEADGPLFKLSEDPRLTLAGRVLRAWSLDELPQLLDVLRGRMSLVGPRPFVTHEIDLDDPWARTRLQVKPGMTGLWQVSGRHRLPFYDLVRYDLFYVENWSLTLDLFILLRTIPAALRRSGA